MKEVSWTAKCEDGVKREVRVKLTHGSIKWQFKRRDEEHWDYDSPATSEDWDELEDILERRAKRGRDMGALEYAREFRRSANA